MKKYIILLWKNKIFSFGDEQSRLWNSQDRLSKKIEHEKSVFRWTESASIYENRLKYY
jgi:hypothetical protein